MHERSPPGDLHHSGPTEGGYCVQLLAGCCRFRRGASGSKRGVCCSGVGELNSASTAAGYRANVTEPVRLDASRAAKTVRCGPAPEHIFSQMTAEHEQVHDAGARAQQRGQPSARRQLRTTPAPGAEAGPARPQDEKCRGDQQHRGVRRMRRVRHVSHVQRERHPTTATAARAASRVSHQTFSAAMVIGRPVWKPCATSHPAAIRASSVS